MPYALIPVGRGDYSVVNTSSGAVHSKHTSKAKAEAQLRLLRGIESGKVARPEAVASYEKDTGKKYDDSSEFDEMSKRMKSGIREKEQIKRDSMGAVVYNMETSKPEMEKIFIVAHKLGNDPRREFEFSSRESAEKYVDSYVKKERKKAQK